MAKKKYITVAEYANLRGITKQAVYKSLSGKMAKHAATIEIDGKPQKVISITALSPEELKQWNEQNAKVLPTIEQNGQPAINQSETNEETEAEQLQTTPAFDAVARAFDVMESQIREKDKLIESLRAELAEKDKYIQEQGEKLSDLFANSQELQRNYQVLTARLSLGAGQEADSAALTAENTAGNNSTTQTEQPSSGKRRFLWWLFG